MPEFEERDKKLFVLYYNSSWLFKDDSSFSCSIICTEKQKKSELERRAQATPIFLSPIFHFFYIKVHSNLDIVQRTNISPWADSYPALAAKLE